MSDDIIVRLKAVEAAEMDVANSCDLPPNLTANWEYAMAVRDGIAELAALRARVAELEAMNKMLCGKLDDQRRALWDPCAPYLKDGETPAQCIARNRRDVDIALSSLARDRARIAELEVIAISICAGNCLPPFPCAQDGCPKRTASNKPASLSEGK